MRIVLTVCAFLGAFAALYWGMDMMASLHNVGRFAMSLSYFGGSLTFAVMCGFGAAALQLLADCREYLETLAGRQRVAHVEQPRVFGTNPLPSGD